MKCFSVVDCSITLDDYTDYRKRLHKDISNSDMTAEQQQDITIIFHRIDKNGSGSITWWEFLNYESARCLQDRKSKVSLRDKYFSMVTFFVNQLSNKNIPVQYHTTTRKNISFENRQINLNIRTSTREMRQGC